MPDQADIIRFHCDCGAKLKAPSAAIGRRIRCPKCKRAFLVTDPDAPAQVVEPQPKPPRPVRSNAPVKSPSRSASKAAADPSQAPPPIPDPSDELTLADDLATDLPSNKKSDPAPAGGDDWLNDLAASESEAETTVKSQVAATPHGLDVCANCQKALPLGAAKCPLCGHAKADPKAKKSKKKKTKAPGDASAGKIAVKTGRFFVGCALSFVGAMIGAGIWMAIAALTGSQRGFVAIALGALCGYGMVIGYGDQTPMAGLAAAGISLMGMIGAKLLIVFYILYAVLSGNTSNVEIQKGVIAAGMTDEVCTQRDCSEDQWDEVYEEQYAKVDSMSRDQIAAKWKEYQEESDNQERDGARSNLAYYRAERRADNDGLALYDDKRDAYYEEEYEKLALTSHDDIIAALVEVDAWDSEGHKNDPVYARVFLADRWANEAAENDPSMNGDNYDENVWQKKWDAHYGASLAKVDAMGEQERIDAMKLAVEQDEKEMEELMAGITNDLSSNGASLAAGAGLALGAALLMLFGPLDILFALFALGAAYKIAAGSD